MAERMKRIHILMVGSCEENSRTLQKLARDSGWEFTVALDCGSALVRLQEQVAEVVVCEEDLEDGDWRTLLGEMKSMACGSRLVVASRLEKDWFWGEVLRHEIHDVLLTPCEVEEVRRVVSQALQTKPARRKPGSERPARRAKAAGTGGGGRTGRHFEWLA